MKVVEIKNGFGHASASVLDLSTSQLKEEVNVCAKGETVYK